MCELKIVALLWEMEPSQGFRPDENHAGFGSERGACQVEERFLG